VVLVVVEPEDHRGVLRHLQQQVAIVAHAVVAEEVDLLQDLVVVVDLGVAGREHVVPEQRHLLFQRALRRHQVIHVVDVAHRRHAAGQQRRRLVPQQGVVIDRRLLLRSQQFLDRRVVAFGRARFEFVAAGAKSGSPHQVGHQCNVVCMRHGRRPPVSWVESRRIRRLGFTWMMLGLRAISGCAGAAVRCAKMREQICAPNLPILTEQASPPVADKPAPKRHWLQRLDRTVRPVHPAGMAGIRASLFIGRRVFNRPLPDGSTVNVVSTRVVRVR
jgi:hypothetical protein